MEYLALPLVIIIPYLTVLVSAFVAGLMTLIPGFEYPESVDATTIATFVWIWTTVIYLMMETYKSDRRAEEETV
jgi:EamA domain-containing membrane protein RarD